MLTQFVPDPIALRAVQSVAAAIIALVMAYVARRQQIYLARETSIALLRGIVQIIAVGFVLIFVLSLQGQSKWWLTTLLLLTMMSAGATIAARRTKQIPGIYGVTVPAIVLGPGLLIGLMALLGVIDTAPASLIPVGSIVIANAMNTMALALDRFRAEVAAHTGQIEAGLALGAAPNVVLAPYVQATIQAAMIPSINNLRSLGIVWIPGVMAGMILAGSNPLEAAIYQFVVIAMLFAAAGTTAILCTLLVRSHVFSAAEQLILPREE